ncbi:MAG TPA: FAD binding domain-containing protein [Candidatus Dormibacteraeota bacterium]
MKPAPFEYHAPTEVAEAVRLLAAYGDEARPLAGGQSLVPLLNLRLARPKAIIDLNRIQSLAYHRLDGDALVVGALCRQRDLERDGQLLERCAAIADALPHIGHLGIRNRGTVVGSLAHADPAAEWPVLALLFDATLVAEGPGGRREIAVGAFFQGAFTTALQPAELLVEARFALPPAGAGTAFVEVARRHGDFALGAAAALVDGPDVRLALGGFDSVPRWLPPDPEAAPSAVNPTGDIHAPEGYRRRLAGLLARRALDLAAERARG